MKLLVALIALAAFASASRTSDLFKNWAAANGRVYTAAEASRRLAVFQANLKRIDELNAEGHALFGLNQFADLTPEEFASRLRTIPPPEETVVRTAPRKHARALPTNFDWRDQEGVVGKVKDQASCGSCWAFSTIEYLESQAVLKQGLPNTPLSPQQIVDCDDNCLDVPAPDGKPCDTGCNGGWPTTAIKYIVEHGSETEKDYPYKGRTMTCKFDETKVAVNFTGVAASLEVGDEASIQDLLYTEGPLSISLDANPWQMYFGGIFESSSCSKEWKAIDHSVLLVGWGRDEATNKDFWTVRNSWGASWGEKGHIRLRMGLNVCGIANMVVWLKN